MQADEERPHRLSDKARIAGALREIGSLLALEQGNRFRSRAYLRAADVVETIPDLEAAVRARGLTSVEGIGNAIAGVIEELATTGRSRLLEKVRSAYPSGTAELSRVLSLPRIRLIHGALGVSTLAELRRACEQGRVRELPGFGEKSERKLVERIDALIARTTPAEMGASEALEPRRRAVLLPRALGQARALRQHLARHEAITAVELAGDLRRRTETVALLELVVACADPALVAAHAARTPGLVSVERQDSSTLLVHQAGGLDAKLRVVPRESFAAALVHATGSATHVAKLRERARRQGFALDERGLQQGAKTLRVDSEQELYGRLGLALVPPELRDDSGELEAAANGGLPRELLKLADLQGAVHCHTDYSDGKHTIEEMARAAEALGLRYLTITDHSQSATMAHGLDVERLQRQADEIASIQERVGIRLLRGTEADILQDGALDFPEAVLEALDVVIASLHQRHKLNAADMTARIVRALRHPLFKIWGHPLGRYVLSRPPIECDLDQVLDAAAESRVAIEVNGDPHRLDLPPPWIRAARQRGIPFVVSCDAHSTGALRNARFGVDMARRGWLQKEDVLNTRSAEEFAAAVRP